MKFYTGIGTADSKDGIFQKHEKQAANIASALNQDALEIYIKQSKNQALGSSNQMQVDNEVLHEEE